MIRLNRAALEAALGAIPEPWLGSRFGDAGWRIDWDEASDPPRLTLHPGYPLRRSRPAYAEHFTRGLAAAGIGSGFGLVVEPEIAAHPVQSGLQPLAGIKNVLAVASGKGGVGKSTAAVNLALTLADEGARVGLLDADIYGPSQPQMLGLSGRPQSPDGKRILPLAAFGLKVMSAGFLVDPATPMIWRGPMVTQALIQLLGETEWGELDYLVVDLPPGTGDIQLTLAQRVPVAGVVIVTTPQQIAVADARKGVAMFRKVEVEVLGIVENMAGFRCPHCGEVADIFGRGGAEALAAEAGVPLLSRVPLDPRIQADADAGRPGVVTDPEGENACAWREFALKTAGELALKKRQSSAGPEIIVE